MFVLVRFSKQTFMSIHRYHYRISSPVKQPREAVWDASKIKTKRSGGGWLLFTDKNNKQINHDFPTCKIKKKFYRHVPYIGPSPHDFDDDTLPRNTEVSENYNAVIPKRELISVYREITRTKLPDDEYCCPRVERKGFIGREPLTAPFRMSTMIINERRLNDLETMRKSTKTAPYRSPRRTHKMNQTPSHSGFMEQ